MNREPTHQEQPQSKIVIAAPTIKEMESMGVIDPSFHLEHFPGMIEWYEQIAEKHPDIRDGLESCLILDPWLYNHNAFEVYKGILGYTKQYPEKRILLVSFLSPAELEKSMPGFSKFVQLPQVVGFSRLPTTYEDLEEIFANSSVDDQIAYELHHTFVIETLRDVRHVLKRGKPTTDEQKLIYAQEIERAREVLGFSKDTPDDMVELSVMNYKDSITKVFMGDLDGVYCDVDGTLLRHDGSFNEEVWNIVLKYEAEGKPVSIWTGGDVEDAIRRLASTPAAGYPVLSKIDFAGAKAEIIIDNEFEHTLEVEMGITAETFIQIP